jgi:enoyl-CoA hydratase/carnithine racemase
MSNDEVLADTRSSVMRATINRPASRNSNELNLLDVLVGVFTTGAADPAVRLATPTSTTPMT